MSESPATALEQQAAIETEYGTWVAVNTIFIDGARAFNVGDAVPASHVERGVVASEQVEKSTTKTGAAKIAAAIEKG